jgi:hypothetical protein
MEEDRFAAMEIFRPYRQGAVWRQPKPAAPYSMKAGECRKIFGSTPIESLSSADPLDY